MKGKGQIRKRKKKYDVQKGILQKSTKQQSKLMQMLSVDTRKLYCKSCNNHSIVKRGNKLVCNLCGAEYKFEGQNIYKSDTPKYSPNKLKPSKGIEYHTDSWTVRGHERHYKNGTTTYVNSYRKGKAK